MKITSKFYIWLRCALIRAVRTIAQAMIATIGTAVVLSDIDWKYILSASAVAGLLSFLTSIATGLPEADAEDEERIRAEARRLNGQDNQEVDTSK